MALSDRPEPLLTLTPASSSDWTSAALPSSDERRSWSAETPSLRAFSDVIACCSRGPPADAEFRRGCA